MKVAIFAGGKGSRLIEETQIRPKPLVEIGRKPILWHIMRHFATYGHKEFVLALGQQGLMIKKYVADLCQYSGNLRVDFNERELSRQTAKFGEPAPYIDWMVELIDTGEDTMTGGRLMQLEPYLDNAPFLLTYGDGVSDVDLADLVKFHMSHDRLATMTVVRQPSSFGHLSLDESGQIISFQEKPAKDATWINGGFFVLEPSVFQAIRTVSGPDVMWEQGPLSKLIEMGELMAYRHKGFWACMDHLADKRLLEEMWENGKRPWASWERDAQTGSDHGPSRVRRSSSDAGIGRGGHPSDWVRYRTL